MRDPLTKPECGDVWSSNKLMSRVFVIHAEENLVRAFLIGCNGELYDRMLFNAEHFRQYMENVWTEVEIFCPECGGTGAKPGVCKWQPCELCGGGGKINQSTNVDTPVKKS